MSMFSNFLQRAIRSPRVRREGQTLVEYTLILAIITLVAVGVFAQLGSRISVVFSAITTILDTAQSSH